MANDGEEASSNGNWIYFQLTSRGLSQSNVVPLSSIYFQCHLNPTSSANSKCRGSCSMIIPPSKQRLLRRNHS